MELLRNREALKFKDSQIGIWSKNKFKEDFKQRLLIPIKKFINWLFTFYKDKNY